MSTAHPVLHNQEVLIITRTTPNEELLPQKHCCDNYNNHSHHGYSNAPENLYFIIYFILFHFFLTSSFFGFDGRIIIHDHIPSNTLRALSPLPSHLTRYVLFLCPFHLPSINLFTSISSSLFTFSTHKRAPCFSHLLELHVYLRFLIPLLPFPKIPSTSLRYDYPFKFQKWNFQQPSLSEIIIISIPKSNNHLYKTQNVN